MECVFFGLEPHLQAPEIFGVLTTYPELNWVGFDHVVDALERGEAISIRPATDSERARADAVIAMYQVGKQISIRLDEVLDPPAQDVAAACTACAGGE